MSNAINIAKDTGFFETIAIKNCNILNIFYHQQRIDNCLDYLSASGITVNKHNLQSILQSVKLANLDPQLTYRLKVSYDHKNIEITDYPVVYQAKQVNKFIIVNISFDYKFKLIDRNNINIVVNQMQNLYGDDIEVIFVKDNFITDTSIANILLKKGNKWYTPNSFLLAGTNRQRLLDNNIIESTIVTLEDLFSYNYLMTINALNEFSESRAIIINQANIIIHNQ